MSALDSNRIDQTVESYIRASSIFYRKCGTNIRQHTWALMEVTLASSCARKIIRALKLEIITKNRPGTKLAMYARVYKQLNMVISS